MGRSGITFEQWLVLIPLFASSVTGAVVSIITALRAGRAVTASQAAVTAVQAVHEEIKPPSNGQTAGALLEGINAASTAAALEATRVRQKLSGSQEPPQEGVPNST